MRYLPILEELFSSDSIIIMIIGLIVFILIGMKLKSTKKNLIGLSLSCAVYVIAEIISNMCSSFLPEIILLFIGTLAIGGVIGFLVVVIASKVRK